MKVLFVNPAWDAAGVSYRQAQAIKKYTKWDVRHFRAVPTFFAGSDITKENYNKDEFVNLIRESNVIHFCSAIHSYPATINWGFNWEQELKGKVRIFHDYCSFPGNWRDRASTKDHWNKREKIGYDAIWSSIPQAVHIYKDCTYIPDFVEEMSDEFKSPYESRKFEQLFIGHFPTGGGNNKNTDEFLVALNIARKKYGNIRTSINREKRMPNVEIIKIKRTINMGFDALWREYHGMTTVENLALGIPTMCNICPEFDVVFKEYFQTDEYPFEKTKDTQAIADCMIKYASDLNALKARSEEVRNFMVNHWSASKVSNDITQKYEKLLERKQ